MNNTSIAIHFVDRNLKHLLEFAGVWLLLAVVRVLPEGMLLGLGRGLGRFTFSILRIRRAVTLDNLRHAFPEKSGRELRDLASRCYRHFGMMMLEYLCLLTMPNQKLVELIDDGEPSASARLDIVLRQKTGAVLISAHLGNWEYLAAWLAVKGYPVSFIAQRQNNPYVNRLVLRTRTRMGMHMIDRRSMGLRQILRALREQRWVFLLPDQSAGRDALLVPFFGRPAATARGAAAFVMKVGVPIVICTLTRNARGRYTLTTEVLRFEQHPAGDEEQALLDITGRYTQALEAHIRRHPEQWLWLHRRWKSRLAATRPAEAAAAGEPA